MIFWRFHLGFLITALILGLGGWFLLFRPIPQPHMDNPETLFNHGSIGNEVQQGLPYWIWRVLPDVFPEHLPDGLANPKSGWEAVGFHWEDEHELPIGFSKKSLGAIPRIAPNCALCHQGVVRKYPDENPQLVTAGPGTQIDVQGFTNFLFKSAKDDRFTADNIMAAISQYEELPLWEKLVYRYLLIPVTRSMLNKQSEEFAWTENNPDWGVGRIDPFNPVKYGILELENDETIGNSDMMPLWNLRVAEAEKDESGKDIRRYSVHWDGLLTDVHETVVAGAIGDGMTYHSYRGAKDKLDRMEDYIKKVMPPPSPFRSDIDPSNPYYVAADAISLGKAIYTQHCSTCHEPGAERFRQPIPLSEVKTDPHRLDMWTQEARDNYANYQDSYDWGFQYFKKTDGYIPVELTGLWLRGPYLHNGSVPNLRALLMPPSERPKVFDRGSDLIDPINGGFASDSTADANSRHWRVDTTVNGNSNQGHLWGTDLTPREKEALLAYLKTL